ncbi:MAG: UDP-glucose/GDP-mannose dehydrogenase family protein [Simkaniaceae bacterium]|nr:UDP-glucose/GDP-mannose dehydrogenase family protein [Simkaniaceae bacterium]
MKIIFFVFFLWTSIYGETIGVMGAGYVGLTLTEILVRCGHQVVCLEQDKKKIALLKQRIVPIVEPGLDSLFSGSASFSDELASLKGVSVLFICVGTPANETGESDYSDLYLALTQISKMEIPPQLVCIKSTLAPGTIRKLEAHLGPHSSILLAYNPEFTREGSALSDFLSKNPIVLGVRSQEHAELLRHIYHPLFSNRPDLEWIQTTPETAELIKYGWNSFSAIRIAYVNELSRLCNHFSGDIEILMHGISWSETLLATKDLKPGLGFGGPCLLKDSQGLAHTFEESGISCSLIHQAVVSNQQHIKTMTDQLHHFIGDGTKKIAIIGAAFKANTDDIRNSPAIALIDSLIKRGHLVRVSDPYALVKIKELFPMVSCFSSPYDAAEQANCIVMLNENLEFVSLDLGELASRVSERKIADFKNIFSQEKMREHGFQWINLGRCQ